MRARTTEIAVVRTGLSGAWKPPSYSRRSCRQRILNLVKKLEEQPRDGFVLLLLHPVSGAIQKMNATHLRAHGRPHGLDGAGALVGAPITLSRDESRWNIDGAAGK